MRAQRMRLFNVPSNFRKAPSTDAYLQSGQSISPLHTPEPFSVSDRECSSVGAVRNGRAHWWQMTSRYSPAKISAHSLHLHGKWAGSIGFPHNEHGMGGSFGSLGNL